MGRYFYLATVYSKHPDGIEGGFLMACKSAAAFIKAGIPVFSPIAHSHPIAVHGDIDPMSHSIWLEADRPLMHAAGALIVLTSDGWRDSVGVTHEITAFKEMKKAIHYVEPGEEVAAARMILIS